MRIDTLARRGVKLAVLPGGVVTRRRPGDLVILLYHRVGAGEREIDLPLASFARQVRALAASGRVTSLEGALAPEAPGGVVVTFDDGSADFTEHAVPLLVEHGVPALLYLATGMVANGGSPSEAITWPQLREAVATGLVAVGAHTHNHTDLSRSGYREAIEEMRRSKETIEDRLGAPCRHFAYPWAVASAEADRAARELFATAALDAWRTNRRGRLDPFRLGRTPVLRSDGGMFFRAKARGLLDGEALAYRVLRRGPWGRT